MLVFDPARGYPSAVPYVRYADPLAALAWLTAVLEVREAVRMTLPDGRIGHAELLLDEHVIALGLASGHGAQPTPTPTRESLRAMTLVFVADVDAATARALDLGGSIVDAPNEMPWGLRQAIVADPEGHLWELSTHHQDVPLDGWGAAATGPPLPG